MWLRLSNVGLSFGGAPILDQVQLVIDAGERIALVGRNGAGKSTLLKLLASRLSPDSGEVQTKTGLSIAWLDQSTVPLDNQSLFQVVASGLGEVGQRVMEYTALSQMECSASQLVQMQHLHNQIEAEGGWALESQVYKILQQLDLQADALFDHLSGGMKRRALLAQTLVKEPDLLLLDEPTNHLDIEQIQWLESYLVNFSGSLVFISHDRSFTRRLADRVIELDRGQISSWPGDYDAYLQRKEKQIQELEAHNRLQDKRLAAEEVWIRQGIKARRTRDEGRVRALEKLRLQRLARREKMDQVNLQVSAELLSGKRVITAEEISFDYPDQPKLIHKFSCHITRGDKIVLMGPNGCGKSTLLKLLLKEQAPQLGQVQHGTKIQLAYFDQLQVQLDESSTPLEFVGEGRTEIEMGSRQIHIMSYLQGFLFSSKVVRSPIKVLSGGERNRLLLAKLLSKPANLLVLDEPTNDLDVETLEILESMLVEYAGTLLIVSHDREFIDHVATNTWVFEGEGTITQYVGGYQDTLAQRSRAEFVNERVKPKAQRAKNTSTSSALAKKTKLSYKEECERQQLPKQIETLEQEIALINEKLSDPTLYQTESDSIAVIKKQALELEQSLNQAFDRWEQLETMVKL